MLRYLFATFLIMTLTSRLAQCQEQCQQGVNCHLPNCFCPTSQHPFGSNNIPQIVYFGFDDAVQPVVASYYDQIFTQDRKNPNGCPITMSLYVSHEYTQYNLVSDYFKKGNEIASHSVTHTDIDTAAKLEKEAKEQKENIEQQGGLPESAVTGWRSPNLKTCGDDQPRVLKKLGYSYDISLTYTGASDFPFPFTLDYGFPYQCMIQPCPSKTSSHKGFWEVMVHSYIDPKTGLPCGYVDGCRPGGEEAALDFLWSNFLKNYESNHAPFGLNMHAAWFATPEYLRAMQRFVDGLLDLPDVYIVNVQQMLNWMKNPVTTDKAKTFGPWGCNGMHAVPFNAQRPTIKPTTKRPTVPTTTRRPYFFTQRPVQTTKGPAIFPKQPVPTTKRPVVYTRRPLPTTRRPAIVYTRQPAPTTSRPVFYTRRPVPTTSRPIFYTRSPVPTTRRPVFYTRKPAPTTRWPLFYTRRPDATTTLTLTTRDQRLMPHSFIPLSMSRGPTSNQGPNSNSNPFDATSSNKTPFLQGSNANPEFPWLRHYNEDGSEAPLSTKLPVVTSEQQSQKAWMRPASLTMAPEPRTVCIQEINCHRPRCVCKSSSPPNRPPTLGGATETVTQIVYLAISTPVDGRTFAPLLKLFSSERRNRHGCPITGTIFIPPTGNYGPYIKVLRSRGVRVSVNPGNQGQVADVRNALPALRPLTSNRWGWRGESRAVDHNEILDYLQGEGALYDSSIISPTPDGTNWPYTLDYGINNTCSPSDLTHCSSHPGFWEVPISTIRLLPPNQSYTCAFLDTCLHSSTSEQHVYQTLLSNFQHQYNHVQAPFGINLKTNWFSNGNLTGLRGLIKFLDHILESQDVTVISVEQMINWVANPVTDLGHIPCT